MFVYTIKKNFFQFCRLYITYLSVKSTSHWNKSHSIEAGTAVSGNGHSLVTHQLLMSLQITHTLMLTAHILLAHIAVKAIWLILAPRDKWELCLPLRIVLGPISSCTFASLQLLWWWCLINAL